jgi:hypothetical protein
VGEEEDHVAPPLEHAEAFSLVPIQGDEGPSEISCFLVGFSPLVNMGLFSIFSYVNESNKWGGMVPGGPDHLHKSDLQNA